jgi:osmotically-inducible protein OsmY
MGEYYETFEPPFFMDSIRTYDTLKVNNQAYDRNDHDVVADIQDHFTQLMGIDTSYVDVSVSHGIVTLKGHVVSQRVKKFLESVAGNALGVRGVRSALSYGGVGASASPD